MAFYDLAWFCNAGDQSTTGYYAVAKRPQNTAVVAGQLCRQFTVPAVGSERVFVCIVAGTTANVTDATWVLTRGAKTTDGTATWQECTGASAVNGDLADTVTWATAKATGTPTLGAIIKRNNAASYQICSTAGTLGASEPAFSDTAGVTTTEGTTTWTSLGVVGNFTGGQAPHARLANACASTWFAVNNTVYVGDNHAESQTTAITIPAISGASSSTMGKIICHNHSGSYPPTSSDLRTSATITTTATANITINNTSGGLYFYGLSFQVGVGVSGAVQLICTVNLGFSYFDNCVFKQASTSATGSININIFGAAGQIIWNNCTVFFGSTSNSMNIGDVFFTWQNTGPVLASGSAVPANLLAIGISNGCISNVMFEALDLSQLTGNLVLVGGTAEIKTLLIKDCKLNAALTIPTPIVYAQTIQLVRSDSSGTAYKSTRYAYEGTETTETSITRVGGAADPAGQAQSRKIVTTANSQWLRPFRAEPYAIWNAVTGANVTVTLYGTINAGTLPNNDDIWLEAEYLGSSASPLGTIKTTTKATLLSSNAAVASDASTWNGGGSGSGWSPFKLTTTLSSPQPGMAGYIHARVRAAKASMTVYIDPQIVLS